MNVTGDQALVKKLNKSIVLERIRLHAPYPEHNYPVKPG